MKSRHFNWPAVVLLLLAISSCYGAPTKLSLPEPAGHYGVARTGFDWVDLSRREVSSSDPNKHRELMVYVWYPSSTSPAENQSAPYLPGAAKIEAKAGSSVRAFWGDSWPLLVSNRILTHTVENGSPVHGSFPVIVFSSGIGMTSFVYTAQIESLVSHGFIVVTIERTYEVDAVAFPDGRVILASDSTNRHPEPGRGESETAFNKKMHAWEETADTYWAADISFVIGKLTALAQDKRVKAPFRNSIDASQVGALGHSLGGRIVARACQLDSHLKACANEDGRLEEGAILAYPGALMPSQPFLFMQHTLPNDQELSEHGYTRERFEREIQGPVIQQLRECPGGAFRIVIKFPHIDHMSFTDRPLLNSKEGDRQGAQAREALRTICEYVTAFFEGSLRNKPALSIKAGDTPTALVQYFTNSK